LGALCGREVEKEVANELKEVDREAGKKIIHYIATD